MCLQLRVQRFPENFPRAIDYRTTRVITGALNA